MFFHVTLDISLIFFNQMILIFQAYFSAFELTSKKYTESGTIIQSDVFTGNPWMIFLIYPRVNCRKDKIIAVFAFPSIELASEGQSFDIIWSFFKSTQAILSLSSIFSPQNHNFWVLQVYWFFSAASFFRYFFNFFSDFFSSVSTALIFLLSCTSFPSQMFLVWKCKVSLEFNYCYFLSLLDYFELSGSAHNLIFFRIQIIM